MMRRFLLALCATFAIAGGAHAQSLMPSSGCKASIPCQAGSVAIGGATIGTDALAVTGVSRFGGNALFATDNTNDIGASGATRPANGYFGTKVVSGTPSTPAAALASVGALVANQSVVVEYSAASSPTSGAQLRLYENDGAALANGDRIGLVFFGGSTTTSALNVSASISAFTTQNWTAANNGTRLTFGTTNTNTSTITERLAIEPTGLLTFGGTTSSFPALKRTTTSLGVRLADDSADAPFTAAAVSFSGPVTFTGTIPTVTGTGTPTIVTGSTDSAGEVTSGVTATSVVITFSSAKTNAPFCVVSPQTNLVSFAYTISTTAITITQTATSGEVIDYHCTQH